MKNAVVVSIIKHDMQRQNLSILKLFVATAMLLIAGCKSREDNDRTWADYKADANSSSYSPLDQINVSNVSQLKPAWTFPIKDIPKFAQPASTQCNPFSLDGVLYAMSAE